eukprot:Gregarina_sp_Poly_1__10386@NODE_744_length_6481_cov_177_190833_g555_i0_p3_GENE_NODE_744_length_6481_cov_177_190833_g555_i0NODE_744_length_6481_cov_177_190833_g555_i0_p3_ORF_typecomplete_len260_score33_77BBE/PF08031_12/1_2e04BBE/PF08031_12/1_4e03BBE/PF08031_12/0_0024_NODE_744_length_6481_cov_177_190833_g555_i041134892
MQPSSKKIVLSNQYLERNVECIVEFARHSDNRFGAIFSATPNETIVAMTFVGNKRTMDELDMFSQCAGGVTECDTRESNWPISYFEIVKDNYGLTSVEDLDSEPNQIEPSHYVKVHSRLLSEPFPKAYKIGTLIKKAVKNIPQGEGLYGLVYLELMGGAINAVPRNLTAFSHRSSFLDIIVKLISDNPFTKEQEQWTHFVADHLSLITDTESLWNFPQGTNSAKEFFGDHVSRIRAIAEKYDPNKVLEHPLSPWNLVTE